MRVELSLERVEKRGCFFQLVIRSPIIHIQPSTAFTRLLLIILWIFAICCRKSSSLTHIHNVGCAAHSDCIAIHTERTPCCALSIHSPLRRLAASDVIGRQRPVCPPCTRRVLLKPEVLIFTGTDPGGHAPVFFSSSSIGPFRSARRSVILFVFIASNFSSQSMSSQR